MSAAALVMTKAAQPGRVKTRLEPLLGPHGCAALQAELTSNAARLADECARGGVYVAVDPPTAARLIGDLVPEGAELFGQWGEDLGQRLEAAAERAFRDHDGPLVVIGTDAPTLAPRHFTAALDALDSGRDAAIGPALDGGYYLIALARPLPELFHLPAHVWGGPDVLGHTLRIAREAGLRVGMLEPVRDLDTPEDAAALLEEGELPDDIAALLRVPAK